MVDKTKSNVKPATAYFAFETTRDPEDGMSPIPRWLTLAYNYEDMATSLVSLHVPPLSMVLRVIHRVDEVMTGVTALVVGDGATANGWIETGLIDPTAAGDFAADIDATFPALGGKIYPDGDTIDITITGVAAAGKGILFAEVVSYAEALGAEPPS